MPTNNRTPALAGHERGSASIEAAIGLPALIMFIGLIIFAGRTAVAHQAVESAAAEAARTASIARTAADAQHRAKHAAQTSLGNQELTCVSTSVDIDTAAFTQPVGEHALIDVTVKCRLDLSDLSVPGVPGTHMVVATASSPIDSWRERSE